MLPDARIFYCHPVHGELLKSLGIQFETLSTNKKFLTVTKYGLSKLAAMGYRVSLRQAGDDDCLHVRFEIWKKSDITSKDYAKVCRQLSLDKLRGMRVRVAEYQSQIREMQQGMIRKIRQVEEIRNIIHGLTKDPSSYRKSFDSIMAMKKVDGVSLVGRTIVVHTKTLYVKSYKIGAFDIVIDTEQDDIFFFNQTIRVDAYEPSMNHPHVFYDGKACFGTVESGFVELLAKRDYVSLVMLAIQFLENANEEDSAGSYVRNWPRRERRRRRRGG